MDAELSTAAEAAALPGWLSVATRFPGAVSGSWLVGGAAWVVTGEVELAAQAPGLALLGISTALLYGALRHVQHLAAGATGVPGLDELPDAILVIDEAGRLEGWNGRATGLCGLDESWRGQPLADAVPADDRDRLEEGIAEALRSGEAAFACRLRTADGTSLICHWRARARRDEETGAGGVLLAARDARREHEDRRALEEREERFRRMVEAAPHLIAVVAAGRVAYINPAGAHLLGELGPQDVVDRPWTAWHDGGSALARSDGGRVEVEVATAPILLDGQAAMLVEARDVSEIHRATAALRESEERLRGVMDAVADAVLVADADGTIRSFNRAAERIFGFDAAEVLGRNLGLLLPAGTDDGGERRLGDGRVADGETRAQRKDGAMFPAELTLNELRLAEQRLFAAVIRDLTALKRNEARLAVAEKVLEATSEGVMVTDPHGTILWINNAFTTISGWSRAEVIGENASLLKSGLQNPMFYQAMWNDIAEGGEWAGEIWNRRKDGEAYPEWLTIKAVHDENGAVSRFVGVFSDISKHKRAEETIRHLTYYDPVTRLPNRYLFQDRLGQAIERARRNNNIVALVLVSLHRFKTVNETLGHQTGDALLREVSTRLHDAVRGEDTVARMRGDTFCCAIVDLAHGADANPVLGRILAAFAAPFVLHGQELFVTASVGASLYPLDGTEIDDLTQKAETAMNHSKESADSGYRFYSPEMNSDSMQRLRLETDLRKAIGRDQLLLHYQPKVEATSGRIVGAEALIRWQHPELGMVGPGTFIPLAEDSGLIDSIGTWVLRAACLQLRAWQDAGIAVVRVAVNLSAHQFRQPDLVERVLRVLDETGVSPRLIDIELTETAVMRNAEMTIQTLMELHDRGIGLAIDDFGTGYSSLSYLKRFPIDKLKIDRSFVNDLGSSAAGEEIVAAIIAMAHSLTLGVVAEGVETERQLELLRAMRCDEVQGYYFSRPLPADEFAALLGTGMLAGGAVA